MAILKQVADVSEDDLYTALKEAKSAAIVEEHTEVGAAVTYRFIHALFRQTLYEEIIAPRRVRLHQQVARIMEKVYAKRVKEHAAEMADHFSHSPDTADLAKAVDYSEMAAQQALAVYAYGEDVRLLEQALKVQEALAPDDKEKRCDLLRSLSNALTLAGETRRALDVELPAALSLAESINDHRRACRACLLALAALVSMYDTSLTVTTPEFARWVERADRYAEPGTVERALADLYLGEAQCIADHPEEGISLLSRSLDLARQLDNTNVFWMVAYYWLSSAQAPQHVEERLHLAEELAAAPRVGLDMRTLPSALFYVGVTFLESGQRQRAEEFFNEAWELVKRSSQPHLVLWAMRLEALLATLDGRLEEALELSRRIKDHGEESDSFEFTPRGAISTGFTSCIHTGRFEEALQLVKSTHVHQFALASTICMARLNRDAEVVEILEQLVLTRPGIGSVEDEIPEHDDFMLLEASVIVRHRKAAELLLGRLAGSKLHITTHPIYQTCPARHLGAAATLLGRPEEARKYYMEAIKVCTEIRFRPELALTRLQLAELLLEHYPKKRAEALEHLNFAIKEFRDMKMRPSLEQALKHKEILEA